MGKILLDYACPFSEVEPSPDVNLAYLKNVAVLVTALTVKPKTPKANPPVPYEVEVYSTEEVALHTDNTEVNALFSAGLNKLTLIVTDTLANADALINDEHYFTLGISGDFDETTATAFTPSDFAGVVYSTASTKGGAIKGMQSHVSTKQALTKNLETILNKVKGTKKKDERGEFLNDYNKAASDLANQHNRCVFLDTNYNTTGSHFAFGKLLSGTYWRDQQYIVGENSELWTVATELGEAESLFDARVSFWLGDDEYGTRLGFFGAGGEGITYPYVKEEIKKITQSAGLKYLTLNKPRKTQSEIIRLEDNLNDAVSPYTEAPYYYLDGEADNRIKLYKSQERYTVTGQMTTTIGEPIWRVKIEALQG